LLCVVGRFEKDQWLDRVIKKAERKVDDLIRKTNVDQVFKKQESLLQIKKDLPKIVKTAPKNQSPVLPLETSEEFAKHFPPGTAVFIPALGQDGVVQGVPNNKGEVPVLSNSMRLLTHWKELKAAQSEGNSTGRILRQRGNQISAPLQDQERVVDLRGYRVEKAVEELEVSLDQATLNNEDRIKIVHGHGTEALKRALRVHLSRSPYVSTWKAGGKDSGGDGVTWVEVKS